MEKRKYRNLKFESQYFLKNPVFPKNSIYPFAFYNISQPVINNMQKTSNLSIKVQLL